MDERGRLFFTLHVSLVFFFLVRHLDVGKKSTVQGSRVAPFCLSGKREREALALPPTPTPDRDGGTPLQLTRDNLDSEM